MPPMPVKILCSRREVLDHLAQLMKCVHSEVRERARPKMTEIGRISTSAARQRAICAPSLAPFVGGSLVPNGGHNLLEPAALAKPVIDQPGVAVLAVQPEPAGPAQGERRIAPAIEEKQRLLATRKRSGDRIDEQVERLAHHAVKGRLWEKAIHYLGVSGGRSSGELLEEIYASTPNPEIKEKVLPELDDDLARSASEFDTLDELRSEIEQRLEAQIAKQMEAYEKRPKRRFLGARADEAPCNQSHRARQLPPATWKAPGQRLPP